MNNQHIMHSRATNKMQTAKPGIRERFKSAARTLISGRNVRTTGLLAAVALTAITSGCSSLSDKMPLRNFGACTHNLSQCRFDLGINPNTPIVGPLAEEALGKTHYSPDGTSITVLPKYYNTYNCYGVLFLTPCNTSYGQLPPYSTVMNRTPFVLSCPSNAELVELSQNGRLGYTCFLKDESGFVEARAYRKSALNGPAGELFKQSLTPPGQLPCQQGEVRAIDKNMADNGYGQANSIYNTFCANLSRPYYYQLPSKMSAAPR